MMDSIKSRKWRLPASRLLPPIVLLLLFFLSLLATESEAAKMLKKPGCNQSEMIRVDRIVARLLPFGPKGRLMPTNDTQLTRFCNESRNLTLSAEDFFVRCFPRDIQPTSKLAMYPPKRTVQQFCGTSNKVASKIGLPSKKLSKRVAKMLKVTPCVNKHLRKNDTCVRRFISQLKTITVTVNDERLKLPYFCCSALTVFHCLEDMLDQKACSRANKEVILDFMATTSDDFFGLACGEYSDASSDKCNSLKPLNSTLLNTIASGKNKAKRAKQQKTGTNAKSVAEMNFITPLFLVIDLLSNLGG